MLTNEQMKLNRYGRWAKARALVNKIQATLRNDGMVVMSTCTKATQFDSRHAGMFKATKTGAYVQRGKSWDCIDYCNFTFYTRK